MNLYQIIDGTSVETRTIFGGIEDAVEVATEQRKRFPKHKIRAKEYVANGTVWKDGKKIDKVDWEMLGTCLLDYLCELNGPNWCIEWLRLSGFSAAQLIYLNFDAKDVERIYNEAKEEK